MNASRHSEQKFEKSIWLVDIDTVSKQISGFKIVTAIFQKEIQQKTIF